MINRDISNFTLTKYPRRRRYGVIGVISGIIAFIVVSVSMTFSLLVRAIQFLLGLTIVIAIIWIAAHFIAKYW